MRLCLKNREKRGNKVEFLPVCLFLRTTAHNIEMKGSRETNKSFHSILSFWKDINSRALLRKKGVEGQQQKINK